MASRINFKSGSCEMLVLYILKNYGDCYAYQISQLITQLSDEKLFFPEGSLYPCFYKMIDRNYISSRRIQAGKKRIKIYYHIEPAGEEHLTALLADYCDTIAGIEKILNYDYSDIERSDKTNEQSI